MIVACLAAAACGSDAADGVPVVGSDAAPEGAASPNPLAFTRPGAGIASAGGTIGGAISCDSAVGAGADIVKLGYVGPNLDDLAALGLETLVFDGPTHILDAYINEVNANGGLNGRCFELVAHEWSLVDPVASFGQICSELPQAQPLMVLSLGLEDPTYQCITLAAELLTFGLYAYLSASQFDEAQGRLYVDDGSAEYLLAAGLEVAYREGYLAQGSRVALFHSEGGNAHAEHEVVQEVSEQFGFRMLGEIEVPAEFANIALLGPESRVGLLDGDLSDSEEQAAAQAWESLPPAQADTLRSMEEFFLSVASNLRDSGIYTVVSTADWSDLRRLMRAAELVNWAPTWILTDMQPALLVLTDVPERQAANVVQVSARRAAGDEIPNSDRGCVTVRNTAVDVEPFSYRAHTDAWNLMTSTCDYLDVIFGAISRVNGALTAESFRDSLAVTEYETDQGSLITFDADDPYANDRFRVLKADPNCVLDDWGCMRAISEWITPQTAAGRL